jgi:hypothetical protein
MIRFDGKLDGLYLAGIRAVPDRAVMARGDVAAVGSQGAAGT